MDWSQDKELGGIIGQFELTDWWTNELTAEERGYIHEIYNSAKGSNHIKTFTIMLGYLKKPEYKHIAYKIIDITDRLIKPNTNIIDEHFYYQQKLETYYRFREEDPSALDKAIEACNEQIAISEDAYKALYKISLIMPTHAGFKQLCIIREKQGNYEEVINLAHTADNQGWSGDWENRIDKCRKKLDKLK